jgi:hypothetical protein
MMMKPPEEIPFSIELLELYQAFLQAPTREARTDLTRQIASIFASERDSTDASASEEYHEFFESYEKAALKFEQQSDRMTRLAVNLISNYLTRNETTVEELIPSISSTPN